MDIDNLTIEELIDILRSLDDEHIQISDRDKNQEFRYKYNITLAETKESIRHLNNNDLHKGPVPDKDPNKKHPVWIFKKTINGIGCYIKLKILNKGRVAVVISFHELEYK